jgi:hypothetical protein
MEDTEAKARLLGSFLYFTKVFYELRTGREFKISQPLSAESHFITIARAFTRVFYGHTNRLIINCPPGSGKSELCKHFIAWALAHYPDSNFLYISHAHELAALHTYGIKNIVSMYQYKKIFDVNIKHDSSAKDNFSTIQGGCVYASGSEGAIVGRDAGLPNVDRFSGAVIIDDIHKPDQVHSDSMRGKVKRNYFETIVNRLRNPNVPIIFIGQRLHEDDLAANLLAGMDGYRWETVILKALMENGYPLYPEVHPLDKLRILQEKSKYVFASQYQQDPQPAGGGIYNPNDFVILDQDPEMICTFIIGDTAETDKSYNDATAFSFFGIYKIKNKEVETDLYGLHWIDCVELRVEPKDLEDAFMAFYYDSMRYKSKPVVTAIEKKSTGTYLLSLLQDLRGMSVIDIERSRASGSKIDRFIKAQPYIASKLISFTKGAKHIEMCKEHIRKITANNTHRNDDICDTLVDGVRLALVDKSINYYTPSASSSIDFYIPPMTL